MKSKLPTSAQEVEALLIAQYYLLQNGKKYLTKNNTWTTDPYEAIIFDLDGKNKFELTFRNNSLRNKAAKWFPVTISVEDDAGNKIPADQLVVKTGEES
jgi:hypothetical protein